LNCYKKEAEMKLDPANFKTLIDGKETGLFELRNQNGLSVSFTNYGGKIVSILVPDRTGALADVVAGYDSIDEYLNGQKYYGAIIGRFGNRIHNGTFTLEGESYQLSINNSPNHIHGGTKSFSDVVWDIDEMEDTFVLSYESIDGEEGYPGQLSVQCVYRLTDDNELQIHFTATTDQTTIVNLTHHSFFNLAGHAAGSVLDHELQLYATQYLPVTNDFVPSGEMATVAATPFDFSDFHQLGERMDEPNEQLMLARGYDHCYVVGDASGELKKMACLKEPVSGRIMDVYSTAPGIQLYTGNWLDGSDAGKAAFAYQKHGLVCLEPQHFPDSPNQHQFPSCILHPGQMYKHTITYLFSW
jgi:aldose 1-epimerase